MRPRQLANTLLLTAPLMCASGWALGQAPATSPKAASPTGAATIKMEIEPSLIVMNAHGAELQGQSLTLIGVAPNTITFADRPVRAAGHLLTEQVIEEWTDPSGSFAKDPPNATVSVLSKDGTSAKDVVVELRSPRV